MRSYRTVSKGNILENENRATILDLVRKSPGINKRMMIDKMNIVESTITHHLRKLVEFGFIEKDHPTPHRVRYYKNNDFSLKEKQAIDCLYMNGHRETIQYMLQSQPCKTSDIENGTSLNSRSITRILRILFDRRLAYPGDRTHYYEIDKIFKDVPWPDKELVRYK